MIEVLVTLVILVFGLLGLAGLQSRAQVAETESYQRTQALVLVRDMADRLSANRSAALADATAYIVPASDPLGVDSTVDCGAPATLAAEDLCNWHAALMGATESAGGACDTSTGANCVGAMIGARGCITSIAANTYLIQVVWQGMGRTGSPPASITCGQGLYDADDLTRRAVTTVVHLGTLL
jgi:type IV pilus assembly protein PilV